MLLKVYKHYPYHFLLESKQISLFSGRFSLIGVDPAFKLTGKDRSFEITALNERGENFLKVLEDPISNFADSVRRFPKKISGMIEKSKGNFEESQRSKMRNTAQVIRLILDFFKIGQKTLIGLYGAFSYDFIRLFEDLGDSLPANEINDYTLFLYDTFLLFDHIKQCNEIVVYRKTERVCLDPIHDLEEYLLSPASGQVKYEISEPNFSLSPGQFQNMVTCALEYIRQGEPLRHMKKNAVDITVERSVSYPFPEKLIPESLSALFI